MAEDGDDAWKIHLDALIEDDESSSFAGDELFRQAIDFADFYADAVAHRFPDVAANLSLVAARRLASRIVRSVEHEDEFLPPADVRVLRQYGRPR